MLKRNDTTHGVFVILEREDHLILLVKRKDGPIWDLPGGRREANEEISECAIREAFEETGYVVELKLLIGEYHQVSKNDIQFVYCGKIIGGSPIINGEETKELRWFSTEKLPLLMVPHRKGQIKDYAKDKRSVKRELTDDSIIKVMNFAKKVSYAMKKKTSRE